MIHLLFTVLMLRLLCMFSKVLDFIKASEWSIYQNAQCFIRSNNCILNFTTISYSLHKCNEMINDTMLKMTIYRLRVTCFLMYQNSWKQKKTCRRVFQTSAWLIFTLENFATKIVSSSLWDVAPLKHIVTMMGPICSKHCTRPTPKEWRWSLGHAADMFNFSWHMTHVHNQRCQIWGNCV